MSVTPATGTGPTPKRAPLLPHSSTEHLEERLAVNMTPANYHLFLYEREREDNAETMNKGGRYRKSLEASRCGISSPGLLAAFQFDAAMECAEQKGWTTGGLADASFTQGGADEQILANVRAATVTASMECATHGWTPKAGDLTGEETREARRRWVRQHTANSNSGKTLLRNAPA